MNSSIKIFQQIERGSNIKGIILHFYLIQNTRGDKWSHNIIYNSDDWINEVYDEVLRISQKITTDKTLVDIIINGIKAYCIMQFDLDSSIYPIAYHQCTQEEKNIS